MKNSNSQVRREDERRYRREHIMRSAERVFGKKGFEDATMREIADEAGIGMQGVYEHFISKQQLYEEALLFRLDEIQTRVSDVIQSGTSETRLRALAEKYVAHFLESPLFFPVWEAHQFTCQWKLGGHCSQALQARTNKVMAVVDRLLQDAMDEGYLRPMNLRLLASVSHAVFNAVIQHHLQHEKKPDPKACADEMYELFMTGLGAKR